MVYIHSNGSDLSISFSFFFVSFFLFTITNQIQFSENWNVQGLSSFCPSKLFFSFNNTIFWSFPNVDISCFFFPQLKSCSQQIKSLSYRQFIRFPRRCFTYGHQLETKFSVLDNNNSGMVDGLGFGLGHTFHQHTKENLTSKIQRISVN